jgi:hypothetical protein
MLLLVCERAAGQSDPLTLATVLSNRMADSLHLENERKTAVFGVNLQIERQKDAVRNSGASETAITQKISQVEGRRDGLYRLVMTEMQYSAYREKKANLITGN